MSFQNPQLLYGLLVLIIPILIHFFNLRKTRKVYFSNTRFLRKVKESTATRKRLKHYLILASRLLFLFFLVLAFAQPFLPSGEDALSGDPVSIYIDNSWSSSNEVEDGITGLERGIAYISELVNSFPPTTQYRLLTNDFLASSRSLKSKREMEELITEIKYSGIPRSVEEVSSRLDRDLEGVTPNLFWISDFQESTLGTRLDVFDTTSKVNLVPLTFSNPSNIYIDSLYVENPLMITDEQVRLHVIFGMIGTGSREVIAKVYLDGVQSGTANVSLTGNGQQETVFDLSVDRSRPHEGKIIFEEFPVTFDNEFNFVINVPERINILEIKSENVTTPVELVFSNEELFNIYSQPSSNLDYNRIELSDLVVLNGLDNPDVPLISALNRYLDNGGTMLIIPGENVETSAYQLVQGMAGIEVVDSANMTGLLPPDYDNPFFSNVFEEESDRLKMPMAQPVWRPQGGVQSILSFPDGNPFLSYSRGRGDLYLLSSPLSETYSSFSRNALFVPIMYKIAVSGREESNELYRFINRSSFSMKQDTTILNALYRLVRDDEEIIPQQRVDGNRIYFEVPRFTLTPGFYELFRDDTFLGLVAFNTDPEESDIRQMTSDVVRRSFQGEHIDVIGAESQEAFAGAVNEKYIGKTLWKEALLLALLFLLVEVLLIRFMP